MIDPRQRLRIQPDPVLDEIEINLGTMVSWESPGDYGSTDACSPIAMLGISSIPSPRPTDEWLGDDDDDEVLLSRHESSQDFGVGSKESSGDEMDASELFASASCCAVGDDDEDGDYHRPDPHDAIQDILQTTSSLLAASVSSLQGCPQTPPPSSKTSPALADTLPWEGNKFGKDSSKTHASPPLLHIRQQSTGSVSENRGGAPVAVESKCTADGNVSAKAVTSASGKDPIDDSPISRYRREIEQRHETMDHHESGGAEEEETHHDSSLSDRIADAVRAAVAAESAHAPSSLMAVTPTPPLHQSYSLRYSSSFRGPPYPPPPMMMPEMVRSSGPAASNMSPLSLDSSSRPLHLPYTSHYPTHTALNRAGGRSSDRYREDETTRTQRLRRHQDLLLYDELLLLPPAPEDDGYDDEGSGEDSDDNDGHDDSDDASRAKHSSVLESNRSTRQPDSQPFAPASARDLQRADADPTLHGVENSRRRIISRRTSKPTRKGSRRRRRSLVDADDDELEDDYQLAIPNASSSTISSCERSYGSDGKSLSCESFPKKQSTHQGPLAEPSEVSGTQCNGGFGSGGSADIDCEQKETQTSHRSKLFQTSKRPLRPLNQGDEQMGLMPHDWEEKKDALELPTLLEEEVLDHSTLGEYNDQRLQELRQSPHPERLRTSSPEPSQANRRPKFPLTRAITSGRIPLEMEKTISLTESDVGSLDGLPQRLKSRWGNDFGSSEREALLRIDGISLETQQNIRRTSTPDALSMAFRPSVAMAGNMNVDAPSYQPPPSQQPSLPLKPTESFSFFSNWPMRLLWGEKDDAEANKEQDQNLSVLDVPGCCRQEVEDVSRPRFRWRSEDDSLALLACANLIHHHPASAVQTSLIRRTTEANSLSYAQAYRQASRTHDPRMPAWVDHQFRTRDRSTKDGQYLLGTSRAVIVHEIVRGHWTWATAWSPDGSQLAVATENHHLAVLDTTSSTVWRVRHDKKIQGPVKQGTTHSIRAIAWGANYIAIGGTGNAVSILSPVEPYNVLQTIPNCGFVGSLHWRPDSNYLVIGSRLDRAIIARVRTATTTPPATACSTAAIDILGAFQPQASVFCETLHTVERKHWVNAVAFSRSGKYLAIGDAGGYLLVYNVHEASVSGLDAPIDEKKELVGLVKSFALDDSVLAVEWSPEGSWLYAGGEDFTVTVIETQYWEVVHKIKRDRWVQCIAASHSGTHVAVGGVSSEVSLLDTTNGWDSVMGIELNGLVPLSAIWHPQDQFLSLTGQNNSIVVVETTNARHVRGHHLHSVGGILAVEFSPDGRMAAVGNDSGVVAFYSLSGASFVTAYELVVTVENDRLSIKWSKNGLFVLIATRDSLLIVGRKRRDRYGKAVPPKCAGFSIRKVVKDLSGCHAVSIDLQSQYISVVGSKGTSILDVSRDFSVAREWLSGPCYATAWSPLGRWLATIGKDKVLTIYETGEERVDRWRPLFSVTCDYVGRALAWGPLIVGGLLYLAYAGEGNEITVMEIRTQEGTWETVMRIQRPGAINALDWHTDGLLAAALSNGTVSIVDLAYLQTGVAVNEMDYNWQRQALTSFTEIRRNRGTNMMRAVRWIPSAPGSDSLLAVGGSDGELEIVDLTERQRCRGYTQG